MKANPNVSILDARNNYESNIGKFKGAITPDIDNFREIKAELEKLPKDQPVMTYCTGDVRCEYLSAYMKHKGFQEVYHLEGGIVKYGQEFGGDGLWEGDCYTFDGREVLEFADKIAVCEFCEKPTSRYLNCANKACSVAASVSGTSPDNTSVTPSSASKGSACCTAWPVPSCGSWRANFSRDLTSKEAAAQAEPAQAASTSIAP